MSGCRFLEEQSDTNAHDHDCELGIGVPCERCPVLRMQRVVEAAKTFRDSIEHRPAHGTHPSYVARQALFDALDVFDCERCTHRVAGFPQAVKGICFACGTTPDRAHFKPKDEEAKTT